MNDFEIGNKYHMEFIAFSSMKTMRSSNPCFFVPFSHNLIGLIEFCFIFSKVNVNFCILKQPDRASPYHITRCILVAIKFIRYQMMLEMAEHVYTIDDYSPFTKLIDNF